MNWEKKEMPSTRKTKALKISRVILNAQMNAILSRNKRNCFSVRRRIAVSIKKREREKSRSERPKNNSKIIANRIQESLIRK